jgi:hypothetical protein
LAGELDRRSSSLRAGEVLLEEGESGRKEEEAAVLLWNRVEDDTRSESSSRGSRERAANRPADKRRWRRRWSSSSGGAALHRGCCRGCRPRGADRDELADETKKLDISAWSPPPPDGSSVNSVSSFIFGVWWSVV